MAVFTDEEQLLRNAVKTFVANEALPAMAEQAQKDGPWDCALGLWSRIAS